MIRVGGLMPYIVLLLRRAVLTCLLLTPVGVWAEASVTDALESRDVYQREAAGSQRRVEDLDDETVMLLSEYHTELERLHDLETYNANMRKMRASQEAEKVRLAQELQEIEVLRRELLPLMVEMIDVLARFIELDQPMLLAERQARLQALQDNLGRSDVALGEKYRRVIEAYQIEAEYGQNIEAYEGTLTLDGRDLTVDFLRVGRLALYYVSLDRSEAGLWHPQERAWRTLNDDYLDLLDFALRVARKQAPPNLMPLPLWTGAAAGESA
jgi:hypothetical protein